METINEGAKYFKAGKMLIDMRDIKNLALLGYAPKNNKNEPDENKPVYRIIFKDNSYKYISNLVENKIDGAILNGSRKFRVPSNANFSFNTIDAQNLLLKLDEKGICASSGSACSSGDSSPSHVLTAIGLSEKKAKGALRITFGEENTKEDVDYLVESIEQAIRELS